MTECKGNASISKSKQTLEPLIEYFAPCPKGFEQLLADELKRLRAKRVRPLKSGVVFFGTKVDGYRVCLWSRIASRVLRVIDRVDASDAHCLYEGVKALSWEHFVASGEQATIAVSARGGNEALRNSQFIALKVKDAVCDRLREVRGFRPNVAAHRPDVPLWVSVHKKKATISIDFAGESLHRRGYRTPDEATEAPLKEALAAGMLVWGGWDHLASPALRRAEAKRKGVDRIEAPVFVDPTCGSGTLVLEAAMMATDRAPGLSRDYWGFEGCADFEAQAFDELLDEADERFEQGLEHAPFMLGADSDNEAVKIAQANARRAGLASLVHFVCADCANLPVTLREAGIDIKKPGFLACNPPYGVRLMKDSLEEFYEHFAEGLNSLSDSWRMCVITPDATFDSSIGYDAQRTLAVYNGAIEAMLRDYRLGNSFKESLTLTKLDGSEVEITVSSGHAQQFASRLRKMIKARRKWAHKHNIHAFRIYDADLPDYAVAIDVFEEAKTGQCFALVSEYQAPREIDPQKAARRFSDACLVAQVLLDIPKERLFTRVRRQDKGGSQYRSETHTRRTLLVEEDHHLFELDLSGYLDTGLFLDHRITRKLVGEMATGKRFLNLFAYTGTASVYAAAAKAAETTTVDMSQTYLDWARRNMQLSGFTGKHHHFVRADVLQWVEQAPDNLLGFYEVIFLDPPTFSNSKTMGKRTWDIQRDHVALLKGVIRLLAPGGSIVFSGNLRSFKLDEQAVSSLGLQVENITAKPSLKIFLVIHAFISATYLLKSKCLVSTYFASTKTL